MADGFVEGGWLMLPVAPGLVPAVVAARLKNQRLRLVGGIRRLLLGQMIAKGQTRHAAAQND